MWVTVKDADRKELVQIGVHELPRQDRSPLSEARIVHAQSMAHHLDQRGGPSRSDNGLKFLSEVSADGKVCATLRV